MTSACMPGTALVVFQTKSFWIISVVQNTMCMVGKLLRGKLFDDCLFPTFKNKLWGSSYYQFLNQTLLWSSKVARSKSVKTLKVLFLQLAIQIADWGHLIINYLPSLFPFTLIHISIGDVLILLEYFLE